MRPDRLLLQDMLEAIDEVITSTPANRDDYDADKFLRSHLVRTIQIIRKKAAPEGSCAALEFVHFPG